jgi:galactonate dehydratase
MYHNDFARVGQIAMSGISVIEIACWDIVGKALGVPVYKLLGGAVRDRIKAYANGWYTVERSPDQFAEAAKRAVARGYRALKFDPFGSGFYELSREEKIRSISLTEAVREAVGPEVELLIEMHGRFNPATAIEIARLLEPYEPSRRIICGRSRRPVSISGFPSQPASGFTHARNSASFSSCRPAISSSPILRIVAVF